MCLKTRQILYFSALFSITVLFAVQSARGIDDVIQFNRNYADTAKQLIAANMHYSDLARDPDSANDLNEIESTLKQMDAFRLESKTRQDPGISSQISQLSLLLNSIDRRILERIRSTDTFRQRVELAASRMKDVLATRGALELDVDNTKIADQVTKLVAAPFSIAEKKASASASTEIPKTATDEPSATSAATTKPRSVNYALPWDARELQHIKMLAEQRAERKHVSQLRAMKTVLEAELQQAQAAERLAKTAHDAANKRFEKAAGGREREETEMTRAQQDCWNAERRSERLSSTVRVLDGTIAHVSSQIEYRDRKIVINEKSDKTFQRFSALLEGKPDPEAKSGVLTDHEKDIRAAREADFEKRGAAVQKAAAELAWANEQLGALKKDLPRLDAATKAAARALDAVRIEQKKFTWAQALADKKADNAAREAATAALDEKLRKAADHFSEAESEWNMCEDNMDQAGHVIAGLQLDLEKVLAMRDVILAIEPDYKSISEKFAQSLPPQKPDHVIWPKIWKPPEPRQSKTPAVRTPSKTPAVANDNEAKNPPAKNTGAKIVELNSGEILEAQRVIDAGDNYAVKTKDGIKTIAKKDVKEIRDAK